MLANLTTLAHFAVSSARNLPNSAAVIGIGAAPRSARLACSLASARPAPIAPFNVATMSAGVFVGAPTPAQPLELVGRHGVGHGRHVRQRRRARRRGHRNGAHFAGTDMGDRRGEHVEHHLHPAADQVGQGLRRTAIGHVDDVDAGHELEQLGRDMGSGAVARRGEVELAGIGLGIGDELGNRFDRQRRIHLHDHGGAHDARDRSDIAEEIEIEVVVERHVDHVRRRDQEQRIAVGRRVGSGLGTDIAAGARPVVDDELLAEPLRQPVADQAGVDVGRGAGRKADDDMHGPRRVGFGAHDARHGRERGTARRQLQNFSTRKPHGPLRSPSQHAGYAH